nr:unnamed protein product [Spirometra erinaceieuropaei]
MRLLILCFLLSFVLQVPGIVDNKKFPKSHGIPGREVSTHALHVDHFSFAKNHSENATSIFFYTGNEGRIEHFAEHSGFIFELAASLSAVVIFAEHRYYGSSLPFGNESFSDRKRFGYLTAEQALADYAEFLTDFKCANPELIDVPVISFGGSYGGMLTAWFRQKYPNIVAGGLAASAPVWLFPGMADCNGFLRVTTETYRRAGGASCVDMVRMTWPLIDQIGSTPEGLEALSRVFKTCAPIPNATALYDFAEDFLITMAMANYPYESSFLGPLPAWPVTEFCKALESCSPSGLLPSPVEKFACALFSMTNYNRTDDCLSLDDDAEDIDAHGWELQTCMEMPTPICANGETDMFKPQAWDPLDFSDRCEAKFGVRPRMSWADVNFWGKNLHSLTNVIFSNGDLDPWSAFGVLEGSQAPNVDIIRIAFGAHHLDLRGSHPNDTSEVQYARAMEKVIIEKWIREWRSAERTHFSDPCVGF